MVTKAGNNGDSKEMPPGYVPSSGPDPESQNDKSNQVPVEFVADVPTLRIPEGFVVMSFDNVSGNKIYPGTVGIKYGPNKTDWLRFSYMSFKKLIDFCQENREQFNTQLKCEREKLQVSDL